MSDLEQTWPATQHPELEDALLATALVQPERWPEVEPLEHLLSNEHRKLHRLMAATYRKHKTLTAVLVANEAKPTERGDVTARLSRALSGHPSGYNVEHYANVLREHRQREQAARYADNVQALVERGATPAEIGAAMADALERHRKGGVERFTPVNLADPELKPEPVRWRVRNLIPERGTVLMWGRPNAGKTYFLLRLVHELIGEPQPQTLNGHPELRIGCTTQRVLWIASEETAERLKGRRDRVLRGMGDPSLYGDVLHLFAAEPYKPVTLTELPELLERYKPHLVVADSLTGLRPKVLADGRRPAWDVDNDAANEMCLMLRGLAERHECAIILVHHTGRDTAKGYRGPTDWWASVDTMWGLEPQPGGELKVVPQKCRDGQVLPEYLLKPEFTEDAYRLEYLGQSREQRLSPSADAVHDLIHGMPPKRVADVKVELEKRYSPSAIDKAVRELERKGLARRNGRENRSDLLEDLCHQSTPIHTDDSVD